MTNLLIEPLESRTLKSGTSPDVDLPADPTVTIEISAKAPTTTPGGGGDSSTDTTEPSFKFNGMFNSQTNTLKLEFEAEVPDLIEDYNFQIPLSGTFAPDGTLGYTFGFGTTFDGTTSPFSGSIDFGGTINPDGTAGSDYTLNGHFGANLDFGDFTFNGSTDFSGGGMYGGTYTSPDLFNGDGTMTFGFGADYNSDTDEWSGHFQFNWHF